MTQGKLGPQNATWWDHHEVTFWLWAFIRNAETYLSSSVSALKAEDELHDMGGAGDWREAKARADGLRNEETLAAYHLLASMGVLLRILKRSQLLFPSLQPSYSNAKHLLAEGKDLRDMVEHAFDDNGYLRGGGRHPAKFVRADNHVVADATSTIIRDGCHWLGNRFCVEQALQEVQAIKAIADTIPPPDDDR